MNFGSDVCGNKLLRKVFCCFSLMVLFCTYPYVFNLFLPLPPITILMVVVIGLTSLLIGLYRIKIQKVLLTLMAMQLFAVGISLMHSLDSEYAKQLLYIIWLFFYLVLLKHFVGVKYFLFCYNRIILIVAILGAFSFLVVLIVGPSPFFEYTNMDGRPGYFFYLTFTNTIYGNIIRYSGIFDEPGAMAYWGIFALLTNKLYVKDKHIEVPLILSLLFTFSMAYYIQLFFYILLFYFHKMTKKGLIGLFFVVSLLLLVVYQSKDTNFDLYKITLARFEYDEYSGGLKGDNRRTLTEKAATVFKESPFFGIGPTAFYSIDYMADNSFETLAKDGIWGTFFLYLPLFYSLVLGMRRREILSASLIILMGYLQRPFHINMQHYVMLYMFMFSTYYYNRNAIS